MSKMGDFIELEELKSKLKAAREEAATYRIKAREKAEATQKLESLENQITYWRNLSRDYERLYKHYKSKYETLTLVRIDDLCSPISEKQKESVKLFITKPLPNKPNNTMEQPIILTENAELYQFRGRPKEKIIEIQIPKNDRIKERKDACKVWFINESGDLCGRQVGVDGRCHDYEYPWDVILKPVPKPRPMTHEEIIELATKGAMFRSNSWKEMEFAKLNGYSINGKYLLGDSYYNAHEFYNCWLYSLDNTKTWHPLTVEGI